MVIRKFNYYRFFVFIIILIAIIVFSIVSINKYKYKKTYDYKLGLIGYSESEIEVIKDKLKNENIDDLLTKKYDKEIIEFINEKYFLYKNLEGYLKYKKEHKSEDYKDIIAIINTNANIEWLENQKETDITKGQLMIVNRIYGLSSEYEPEDIVSVPARYAYNGVKISDSILDSIMEMIEDARSEGFTFVLSDGYRSYKTQEEIYDSYKKSYGEREADNQVARPGHSEYQTGISFNIVPYNKVYDNPKESEEYKWLSENAHKYGFIFRFPEDKTKLTGFDAFTWRLRYVGTEASTIIYNDNLCYEEYYAYYIDKE
jgi:D-alanyl-D-alanine carboxypeptidase